MTQPLSARFVASIWAGTGLLVLRLAIPVNVRRRFLGNTIGLLERASKLSRSQTGQLDLLS